MSTEPVFSPGIYITIAAEHGPGPYESRDEAAAPYLNDLLDAGVPSTVVVVDVRLPGEGASQGSVYLQGNVSEVVMNAVRALDWVDAVTIR